jgi:hypothetical protein
VGLVEVEVVDLEAGERLVEALLCPVAFGFAGLAGDEEPVAERREVWPDRTLGEPVAGGDVEVVDAGGEGLGQERLDVLGGVGGEGGAAQDGGVERAG